MLTAILKWNENLPVSVKIVLAFTAVMACTFGLGAFAIDRLHVVDDAASEIRSHWLPRTQSLGELAFFVQRFRVIEAAAILAPADAKPAEIETLNKISGQIGAALTNELTLARTDSEKAELANLGNLWRSYLRLDAKFLDLEKSQGQDAASELYRTEMREAIHSFQDPLAAAVARNAASGKSAARNGSEIAAFAFKAIVAMIAVATLFSFSIGYSLWRGISRPVRALTRAMTALASGDFSVTVPGLDLRNEMGEMARSTAVFKDRTASRDGALQSEIVTQQELVDAERDRAHVERARANVELSEAMRRLGVALEGLANGDLGLQLDEAFSTEYAGIRNDFNAATSKLSAMLRSVVASTEAIRISTEELSRASDHLSNRTERQAASLEETAAALDVITQVVKHSAAGADHARTIVQGADSDANKSASIVREAVEAMSAISRSSDKISQIIGVIDEIAFQTNLLALNAGVEAARAGDAGRGFAVVASEVRALALRSASAAKEIKELIRVSGGQVAVGVKLVDDTGITLEHIVARISRVNTIVGEIAAGAAEQANGLSEINIAITEMDKVTQENAAMVQEATAVIHTLSQSTGTLTSLVGLFRLGAAGAGTSREAAPKSHDAGQARPQTRRLETRAPRRAAM